MKIKIRIDNHIYDSGPESQNAGRIFQSIIERLDSIMATTAETKAITAQILDTVRAQKTRLDSLDAFVEGLQAQVKEIVSRPDVPDSVRDDLTALLGEMQANTKEIEKAFVENTPEAGAATQ